MSAVFTGPLSGVSPGLPGGDSSVLVVLNPQVIKPSPGILARVVVVAPGVSGSLSLNDCAALGDASSANEINTFSNLTAGQGIKFDWPCATGIVVSSLPSGAGAHQAGLFIA